MTCPSSAPGERTVHSDLHSATVTAPISDEVRAFRRGFGSPVALHRALRVSKFIVPVDLDLRAVSFHSSTTQASAGAGGDAEFRWVCAHTTPERCSEFADTHRIGQEWHFVALSGAYLLDTLLPRFATPTGLFVDPGTEGAVAFPPTTEFMPDAPWAVDVDDD